jgi:hypothetical protein
MRYAVLRSSLVVSLGLREREGMVKGRKNEQTDSGRDTAKNF